MRKLLLIFSVLFLLVLSLSMNSTQDTVVAQDNTQLTPIEGPFSEPSKVTTPENLSDVIEGPFYVQSDVILETISPEDDFIIDNVTEGPSFYQSDADVQDGLSNNQPPTDTDQKETDSAEQVEAPESTVSVVSAWTTDGSNNTKTVFIAGDAIRYQGRISNTTGGARTAYLVWSRTGPCGTTTREATSSQQRC